MLAIPIPSLIFIRRSIVLDYDIQISPLEDDDKVFVGGPLGNYRSVELMENILIQ